jgi:hypothetical protein
VHVRARLALAVCAAIACSASSAYGAPDEGTVSLTSPALVWQGSAGGSPVIWADFVLAGQGNPIVCPPVFCHAFSLHVADSSDLRIESSSCEDDVTFVEVERPDGTREFADGLEGSPRTIVDIANAPVGTYVVRTLVNRPPPEGAYVGHATLATPPSRVSLTAVSRMLKVALARRGRAVQMALSASGPITGVRGVLRSGRSIVGSGGLLSLDGRGKLAVTLSRALRPGRYRLTVTADDGVGEVVATAVLRISRRHARARAASRRPAPTSPSPATVPDC